MGKVKVSHGTYPSWHCCLSHPQLSSPQKGFGDTVPPPQAQKGLAKGALLLPQRLLDPKSIYCTTPYLETENGAGDT